MKQQQAADKIALSSDFANGAELHKFVYFGPENMRIDVESSSPAQSSSMGMELAEAMKTGSMSAACDRMTSLVSEANAQQAPLSLTLTPTPDTRRAEDFYPLATLCNLHM